MLPPAHALAPDPLKGTRGRRLDRARRRRIPRVVLLIESSRASGRSLLTGIADYARHHGPWAFYWEPGGLEAAWPKLKAADVDGIILRDLDAVDEVTALALPAIVVGHQRQEIPNLANVVTDSYAIGKLAAEHLLERRLQHFAYCGFEDAPWSVVRGDVFARRIAEAGFKAHSHTFPSPLPKAPGKRSLQAMSHWLRLLPKPLGLMACNDDCAEKVIEACKLAGLRVPDEIAILGADNDELVCELSDPRLSSVGINFERAGYESAQALDELMRGRRLKSNVILVRATRVVTRQSTDILAVDDPALGKALRYIHDHAHEPMGVADIASAAGLSRRVLEKRFRTSLSRSVLSQIRRVRVDQISRMLVETNQSVSQIAFALGYSGVEHIARYFRSEKNMTPLTYRRQCGRK